MVHTVTRSVPLEVGMKVQWLHTPKGGYGYSYWVPAVVVNVGKRITIDAELNAGGTRRISVKPEHLR